MRGPSRASAPSGARPPGRPLANPLGPVAVLLLALLMLAGPSWLGVSSSHASSAVGPSTSGLLSPRVTSSAVPAGPAVTPQTPGPSFGVLATLQVSEPTGDVVVDPVTGWAYVSSWGNITAVNGTQVQGNIPTPQGSGPGVFDAHDGFVYVLRPNNWSVVVIDKLSVVTTIVLGYYATGIAYDARNDCVYIADQGERVAVINGTAPPVNVTLGSGLSSPWSVAYDAADGYVYVTVGTDVAVLNGTSVLEQVTVLPGPFYPYALQYDPVNDYVYVLGYNETILAMQGLGFVGSFLPTGYPFAVAVDPVSGFVYALSDVSTSVAVVSNTTVVGDVQVGGDPADAVFDPALNEMLIGVISSNTSASELVEVRGTEVLGEVTTGRGPVAGVFDPTNDLVYEASELYSGATVTILGTATFYSITFSETGIPANITWSVEFDGIPFASNGSVLTVWAVNGTYPYILGGVGAFSGNGSNLSRYSWSESPLPYSGDITVNNANVTELPMTFVVSIQPVLVIFGESGLPAGAVWSVTFNGTTETSLVTNGGAYYDVSFEALPGTYAYSIGSIAGYYQASLPRTGEIVLTDAFATVYAEYLAPVAFFSQASYALAVAETGLPSGTTFNVSVGGLSQSLVVGDGPTGFLWTGLPNGTYAYSIDRVPGWVQASVPRSGVFTVHGGDLPVNGTAVAYSVTLSFAPYKVPVTFAEFGLPSGTPWTVTVGASVETSTTGSLEFELSNGTADYRLTGVPGWQESTAAYRGSLTVDGAPVFGPTFGFVQVTYALVFTESGLASGSSWSVVVGGSILTSTSTSVTFDVPNGSYAYDLLAVSGYGSSPSSGQITVGPAGAAVAVTFSATSSSVIPSWAPAAGVGAAVGAVAGGLATWLVRRRGSGGPGGSAGTPP